jgi:CBS domain-containing protein
MKAKDIMIKKVITVSSDTSIEELAGILTANNISGVPVVDKDNNVIGIITEKDILYKDSEPRFPPAVEFLGATIYMGGVRKYNERLKKVLAANVAELMTKDVISVHEDDDIKKIVDLMLEKNINRLPVFDSGHKLSGIIGRSDIVRAIAKTL